MNSIFVIAPYEWEGMWVFDDPRMGLYREPFVPVQSTAPPGNENLVELLAPTDA